MLALDCDHTWSYTIGSPPGWPINVWAPTLVQARFLPSADVANAYDWASEFVAWANSGSRPWAGYITFEWGVERASDGGAALFLRWPSAVMVQWVANPQVSLPGSFAATTDGGWSKLVATAGAEGTWYPRGGLSLPGLSGDLDAGAAGPAFGARPGAPGLSALAGRAEAAGLLVDASRLTGLLTSVQQPIRGRVFSAVDQTWHYVLLGEVSRSTRNPGLYGWTLEVWQEP